MADEFSFFQTLAAVITGTFIMGTCMDSSTGINRNINRLERELKPQTQEEQVLGDKTPERFYVIDGKRAYLTIDGKPVEQYMNSSDLATDNKNNF